MYFNHAFPLSRMFQTLPISWHTQLYVYKHACSLCLKHTHTISTKNENRKTKQRERQREKKTNHTKQYGVVLPAPLNLNIWEDGLWVFYPFALPGPVPTFQVYRGTQPSPFLPFMFRSQHASTPWQQHLLLVWLSVSCLQRSAPSLLLGCASTFLSRSPSKGLSQGEKRV